MDCYLHLLTPKDKRLTCSRRRQEAHEQQAPTRGSRAAGADKRLTSSRRRQEAHEQQAPTRGSRAAGAAKRLTSSRRHQEAHEQQAPTRGSRAAGAANRELRKSRAEKRSQVLGLVWFVALSCFFSQDTIVSFRTPLRKTMATKVNTSYTCSMLSTTRSYIGPVQLAYALYRLVCQVLPGSILGQYC